jgi:hypothetical protein
MGNSRNPKVSQAAYDLLLQRLHLPGFDTNRWATSALAKAQ